MVRATATLGPSGSLISQASQSTDSMSLRCDFAESSLLIDPLRMMTPDGLEWPAAIATDEISSPEFDMVKLTFCTFPCMSKCAISPVLGKDFTVN